MVAFAGFAVQALVTREGPVTNLSSHLAGAALRRKLVGGTSSIRVWRHPRLCAGPTLSFSSLCQGSLCDTGMISSSIRSSALILPTHFFFQTRSTPTSSAASSTSRTSLASKLLAFELECLPAAVGRFLDRNGPDAKEER